MGVADVQIEKEKIDHVPVKQAISKISQNPGKEKRQRNITPMIRPPVSHQQNRHDDQCDQRNYDEESIVALEGSKRCAGIGDVNQTEEIGTTMRGSSGLMDRSTICLVSWSSA